MNVTQNPVYKPTCDNCGEAFNTIGNITKHKYLWWKKALCQKQFTWYELCIVLIGFSWLETTTLTGWAKFGMMCLIWHVAFIGQRIINYLIEGIKQ